MHSREISKKKTNQTSHKNYTIFHIAPSPFQEAEEDADIFSFSLLV